MEITSFFPEVFTNDIDISTCEFVNNFGFEIKHKQENGDSKYYILENKVGNKVALVSFPTNDIKEGLYAMRINVRNIEEAIEYFLERGFVNPGSILRNGNLDIHGKARYELMEDSNGYRIDLVEHLRDQ